MNCPECNKSISNKDHPNAKVYHLACLMEILYGQRNENPKQSIHKDVYARSCQNRDK